MSSRKAIIILVVGIVIGVVGAVYLPGKLRPYLPESIVGRTAHVTGTVVAKDKQGNALRLTVDTPQGALVATFTQKVDETNLLVGVNDKVEIGLAKYEPFVSDPRIYRVLKGSEPPSQATAPTGTTVSGATTTKAARPSATGKKEHRPDSGE